MREEWRRSVSRPALTRRNFTPPPRVAIAALALHSGGVRAVRGCEPVNLRKVGCCTPTFPRCAVAHFVPPHQGGVVGARAGLLF
eukprot:4192446-Prymnesium_polylepis.1